MKKIALSLATVLMFTGCSVEDSINEIFNTNVIYAVNGTGGSISLSVTGQNTQSIISQNQEAAAYILSGRSEYDISYDGGHKVNVKSGSVYLYTATTCNNDGYILDSIDSNRVHIVNLSGETITEDIVITGIDGIEQTITQSVDTCKATSTSQANNIKVGNGMKYRIGNATEQVVSGIPTNLEGLANSLKLDLVIYSTSNGTIVPMAGYDDLFGN